MNSLISNWLLLTAQGVVALPPGREVFREYFESLGFDFGWLSLEDLEKLSGYPASSTGPVVRKIMGEAKKADFEVWVKNWAHIEALPHLEPKEGEERDKKSNFEGLKGLFYDLVAYAAGAKTPEQLVVTFSARMINGKIRRLGFTKKEYRMHILVVGYNGDKPFAPASFPEDYPSDLLEFLERWEVSS